MKPSQNRVIFNSCLILLLAACICLCAACIAAAAAVGGPSVVRKSAVTPTPFPLDTLPGEQKQAETSRLPADIRRQMDLIQQQVIQERGLLPNTAMYRTLISRDELSTKVADEMFADYTRADADQDMNYLLSLGLVDSSFDPIQFYKDFYAEEIAGYYDNTVKEMYVIQGADFGAQERLTYAHEYTHALQDQNYDIENGLKYGDKECENQNDRCAAIQALLEGDATLSEQIWQDQHYTSEEHRDLFTKSLNMDLPVFQNAPKYFQQSLFFPYSQGFEFVNSLYEKGGWDAVDQAYKNPPVSTAQILHPEKYPDVKPVPVTLPSVDGMKLGDMQLQETGTSGEWELFLLLSAGVNQANQLTAATASKAAAGWAGDQYALYASPDGSQRLYVQCVRWENETEADEFASTFADYAQKRWGGNNLSVSGDGYKLWGDTIESAAMRQNDSLVCWDTSTDPAILREILTRMDAN
jgi:hypothetical protein